MYAKSNNKQLITDLNNAIHEELQKRGGNKYISNYWDILKQDIHEDWYIRFLDIVEVPEGVGIVETVELPEDDVELEN